MTSRFSQFTNPLAQQVDGKQGMGGTSWEIWTVTWSYSSLHKRIRSCFFNMKQVWLIIHVGVLPITEFLRLISLGMESWQRMESWHNNMMLLEQCHFGGNHIKYHISESWGRTTTCVFLTPTIKFHCIVIIMSCMLWFYWLCYVYILVTKSKH